MEFATIGKKALCILDSRWLARVVLLILVSLASYVAFNSGYNMAVWTPNSLMRSVGMPYEWILGYEHHLNSALHFIVAVLLVILLYQSRLFARRNPALRNWLAGFLVLFLAIMTELIQVQIGRGFERLDIFLGLAGVVCGYLVVLFVRNSCHQA